MISFYSLTAVKKLGTLRVIGLCTSIAFVLVSSRSCLLLRLQILARQITTLAIVSLSVPVSPRTQFVRLDSEKIACESFTDRLAIVSDISLPSTGFLARLSVSLQICLPDSSLEFWQLVP